MQIFVNLLDGRTRAISLAQEEVEVALLKEQLAGYEGIPAHEQRLTCAQRELADEAVLKGDSLFFLSLSLRVLGGKGGFGSLLRGAPSRIGQKKTDNFDACRDLNGRRLRDVNNEKKLMEWIKNEKQREEEKQAKQQLEKIAKQHTFDDAKYTNESNDIKDSISSALERGIDVAKKNNGLVSFAKKRALEEEEKKANPQKRRQIWAEDDDLFDGESEPETKEKKVSKGKNDTEKHPLTPPESTTTTTTTATTTTTTSSSSSSDDTSLSTTTTTTITSTTSTTTTSSSSPPSPPSDAAPVSTSPAVSSAPVPSLPEPPAHEPVDLSKYDTAKDLEDDLGGERLKAELQRLGLLCGGTPADRAARLFLLKTTPLWRLDKKYFAKKKK